MAGIINDVLTGESLSVTNPVTVDNGGTGTTSLTANGVLVGNGTSAVNVTTVGTAGQVLTSNGAGLDPTFQSTGDVVGPASSTDNVVVRFDGATGKTIQNSGAILSDTDGLSGLTQLDVDNIQINGNIISSTDVNGNIILSPNGTGVVETNDISASSASDLTLTLGDAAGSNKLSIQNSTPTEIINVNSNGWTTMPLQPAFSAELSANLSNATGDGTIVAPVIFDTEIFDQNGDYDTSTGIFTSPVTGRVRYDVTIGLFSIDSGHTTGYIEIPTSNRTYRFAHLNPAAIRALILSADTLKLTGTVFADMDAADTASVTVSFANSTKTMGIWSGAHNSQFMGNLAC